MAERVSLRITILAALAASILPTWAAAAGPPITRHPADDPRLDATLQEAAPGSRLEITGVRLAELPQTVDLELERFDVFTPDAVVEIHGPDGVTREPAPHLPMYRGMVAGDPQSIVFLMPEADGTADGFARVAGRTLRLSDALTGRLELSDDLSAELAAATPYRCDTAELPTPAAASDDELHTMAASQATAPGVSYGVEVAVETDAEYYAKFGNVAAATRYVAVLFGGANTIYRAGLDTVLVVKYLSLWTGGTGSDPWGSYSNTCYYLAALGNYWHTNHPMASLPRDTVHLLSGKNLGGGIAWVGVLTSNDYSQTINCGSNVSTYSGGYGLVANIAGSYHPTNSHPVWDIIAVSHEIGHNFNSPHTHCYANIPTAGKPDVDHCYSGETGCYSGTTSLPSGGGSIMSYCHLLSGGYNNINLSFGAPGLYGSESERVPQRMRAHVDLRSSGLITTIFWDGFESNGTYFWQTVVP